MPYENLSDSFSTNCSATDAVVAVELTTAPETKVAVAVAELVATPCGFASPSLTRVAPQVAVDAADVLALIFAVKPPMAATVVLEDTSAPLDTILSQDAAVVADAVAMAGRTAVPNVAEPNALVP